MPDHNRLPIIPEEERSPLVEQLLALVEQLLQEALGQAELIQQLRDEIAALKGEKGKPKFKPSGMDPQTEPTGETPAGKEQGQDGPPKRPGSAKRHKSVPLTIHETLPVAPNQPVPAGSRFKGYRDFVVQDLRITTHNTRDRLEVWQTPAGERLVGTLPSHREGSHFGPELRRFVRYQHHQWQVTQPLLHEQLREWGIDISVGQIDALLSGHREVFLAEKDQLRTSGLAVSRWITVDDSGARHQGRHGYVTQIGNAWFASTESKRRINCLQVLHAGDLRYVCNDDALTDWCEEHLPKAPRERLQGAPPTSIVGVAAWSVHLEALGIRPGCVARSGTCMPTSRRTASRPIRRCVRPWRRAATPSSRNGPPLRPSTKPLNACIATRRNCCWYSSVPMSSCIPTAAKATSAAA